MVKRIRGRKPTTGKYNTRKELVDAIHFFYSYQTQAQVARTTGVSETTVKHILKNQL